MFKILFFLGAFSIASHGWSQSLEPFVISPAGAVFVNSNANASLSFTIGEMAMVETFQNSGFFLTQGFQQPKYEAISVAEEDDFVEEFIVFPNPANDFLNIRYRFRFSGEVRLQMVNLNGVQVLSPYEDRYMGGLKEDMLSLDNLAQGMYVLQVMYDIPAKNIHHISYHKINVIKH